MTFAEKIAAAQEAAANAPKQPNRRGGPTIRDHVSDALDNGATESAAVLRHVLNKQGFRSAALDAMSDADLMKVCATSRTVDMTLRRERRRRGQ